MLKIGSYNELVVEREVDFGFYLNPKPDEVLLPMKYAPKLTKPGDTLRVFVYTDSEDRPVATTQAPKAVVGQCAFLEMNDHASFGVFMDWGLEKDLLVPKREQQPGMQKGKKYVVKVCLDQRTQRVYGTTKITSSCVTAPMDLGVGQQVDLLVYKTTKTGYLAVVDDKYSGMLYNDQIFEHLGVGDRRKAYINQIRDDGKIDLALKKPGYRSMSASGQKIMAVLKGAGGFTPCHDKSTPAVIKKTFSLSKKEFKRAIGGLYKAGKIEIKPNGIHLKKEG